VPIAPFALFGPAHLGMLLLIGLAVWAVWLFRMELRQPLLNRPFRYGLAATGLLSEAALHVWLIRHQEWSLAYSLPLHLCSLSILFSIVMLINRHQALFEFTYIAGLAGALQAVLTPNLGGYPFPHFLYLQFFLTHGLIIVACCFMIFVERYRPRRHAVWRTFLALNAYLLVILLINRWTGGNYLYVSRKPAGVSLLDYLGPWPWYLLTLEGVTILFFCLAYAPFWWAERLTKRRRMKGPSP